MKALTAIHTFVLTLALLAGMVYVVYQAKQAEGSVSYGNEYTSRVVTSSSVGTSSLARKGSALGSVVVSSTSPLTTAGPYIAFYDTASTTVSTTSLTAFATMGAEGSVTPSHGTYTFDATASTGIMMWVDPSFSGSYTVTYR